MIFKRFEPLMKGEKRFFMGKIPSKAVFAVIFSSFIIYGIVQLSYTKPLDFYGGLIIFSFLTFLALGFPYMLVQFLVDIHNNQKKIFIFELTKKETDVHSDNNDYVLFHYERKFRLDRTITGIEDFYEKIAIGDIIELLQLPKSGEFIRIQKIENIIGVKNSN